MDVPADLRSQWISQTQLILTSYRRLLGRDLLTRGGDPEDEAERLFEAPFVALSHGTEADPVLNYANRVALALWQMTPETLVATPSRLTAEPMQRSQRQRFLEQTAQQGFMTGYEGVRISTTGKRFLIQDATIWNLTGDDGRPAGQAATFAKWSFLR